MSNFVASFEMGCIVSIDFSIVEHALINSRVVFSLQTFISTQIVYRMQLIWMYTDFHPHHKIPGRVVQSVTCLATDVCLTADPGVGSSIPVGSHTSVEIDHEIISTVILLPSADLFKKVCCQLQAKACAQITG